MFLKTRGLLLANLTKTRWLRAGKWIAEAEDKNKNNKLTEQEEDPWLISEVELEVTSAVLRLYHHRRYPSL